MAVRVLVRRLSCIADEEGRATAVAPSCDDEVRQGLAEHSSVRAVGRPVDAQKRGKDAALPVRHRTLYAPTVTPTVAGNDPYLPRKNCP